MDQQTSMDVVSNDAQIASVVTYYDFVTDLVPRSGRVELLIDPSIETECDFTDLTVKCQIRKPAFEGWNEPEF